MKTAASGYTELRLAMDPSGTAISCGDVARQFLDATRHEWPETRAYAIDQPVYVLPSSGVVITESGQIIAETIYPSSGEQSEERILGVDLTEETLPCFIRECETLEDRWWSPLLSRWSNVYFHAVTEGLVQQFVHRSLGLDESLAYIAPVALQGSQQLIVSKMKSACIRTPAPIVKAPRLVITDDLYQHAMIGTSFRDFAEEMRRQYPGALHDRSPRRIYVSRRLAETRRMRNEAALIEALSELDFHILEAERLSFDEQLRLFSEAEIIVGPHGAGLVNAAFAPDHCILFELRSLNRAGESPYWGASYKKLATAMQMPFYAHVSENEYDEDDWDADIVEILRILNTLIIDARQRHTLFG